MVAAAAVQAGACGGETGGAATTTDFDSRTHFLKLAKKELTFN